jgi:integrase
MSRNGIGLFQHKNKPIKKRFWSFKYKDAHGIWREKSTGKLDKKKAWDEKQKFLAQLEAGALPNDMSAWTLKAAIDDYNSYRKVTASRKTAQCERGYLRTVVSVWGEKRVLKNLQPLDLERYQVSRRASVAARTVNIELKTVRQLLKRANLWHRFAGRYKELKVPPRPPVKVLTPEQGKILWIKAQEHPAWMVAFCCCALAHCTGLRPIEIRHLHRGDVVLVGDEPYLTVHRSKTEAGLRTIPLNSGAVWALSWLIERAKSLGASEPEHFILPVNHSRRTRDYDPLKGRKGFDPTMPQGSWRGAWEALRKAAGMEGYWFYHSRHTFITKLCQTKTPPSVSMALVGHRSQLVHTMYQHIEQDPQRQAVLAAEVNGPLFPLADLAVGQ